MDLTSRIINLLPPKQQNEIFEKAITNIKEQLFTIITNLSSDKLILAHEYLNKLQNDNFLSKIKSGPTRDMVVEPVTPNSCDSDPQLTFVDNLYVPWTSDIQLPKKDI
jgi:hypothetical protein